MYSNVPNYPSAISSFRGDSIFRHIYGVSLWRQKKGHTPVLAHHHRRLQNLEFCGILGVLWVCQVFTIGNGENQIIPLNQTKIFRIFVGGIDIQRENMIFWWDIRIARFTFPISAQGGKKNILWVTSDWLERTFCEHGQPSHLAANMACCLEFDSKTSSCASFVAILAQLQASGSSKEKKKHLEQREKGREWYRMGLKMVLKPTD